MARFWPVTAVCSIDEMACRLMGRERPLLAALELGRKVKATIRARVGECMRSSVGLATNRYLAKVASDMEKPDGLVALTLDILPEALRRLTLRDLPGIDRDKDGEPRVAGLVFFPFEAHRRGTGRRVFFPLIGSSDVKF